MKVHQFRSLARIQEARKNKGKPILAVAPPGAGKSRVIIELAIAEARQGGSNLLLVHRKMLLDQLVQNFTDAGLDIGVISPDYPPNPQAKTQIASAQTIFSRAVRRSSIELPPASLVLIDEAHQQAGAVARSIVFGSWQGNIVQVGYANQGVDVVGFTATPLMNSRIYKQQIEFATYSELRRCNMHQLIQTVGPSEIDTAGLKLNNAQEYSERKLSERVEVIFGDVFNHWQELNPFQLPTILFAPSVPSSRWFANQFFYRGVPVAHIDGESCLIPEGDHLAEYKTTKEIRDRILEMSRTGEIKCVMNRFVLREAVDMPWLYHGIAATVFGSTTTALQSVGRLQRYWPEYDHKIFQDHGGFYWRHGDPNDDREWTIGATNKQAQIERVNRILEGSAAEGIRCPKCGSWRKDGDVCWRCNNKHKSSVRVVRQINGKLKRMTGRVYTKKATTSDAQKMWTSCLFAAGKSGRPVSSAVKIYSDKLASVGATINWQGINNAPPPPDSADWHLLVKDVFPWTVRRKARK